MLYKDISYVVRIVRNAYSWIHCVDSVQNFVNVAAFGLDVNHYGLGG